MQRAVIEVMARHGRKPIDSVSIDACAVYLWGYSDKQEDKQMTLELVQKGAK